ncbi:uncharacterized protein UV8b_05500 [Ustilaginoidea virens]|uniref:L-ornithine N(5)-oxygenase n=1 Tax=Ustilaginoidea virens TaxID=1159556 RepID=A0A8E5MIP9_USTVR|nr:uncharacterized protein UV8b_05500 [Ustilaginoidea virens]QUC21257.1 hypothetical protein UV8b_05500 [Ustilaginoidea virens]
MEEEEAQVYDVVVVGAGPAGLATAARLREHTPAALFTDEEHRRFHWINKYGRSMSLKHVRSGKVSAARRSVRPEYKMLVLDGTDDQWLGRWNELFGLYDISHLRSPMLWHVDPLDRDSLLAHAYAEERERELVEIRNCVGREMSKHGRKRSQQHCGKKQEARVAINLRERNDYYTPSQSLFRDHCQQVARRYALVGDIVRKDVLVDLDYGVVGGVVGGVSDDQPLFTLTTASARQLHARTVVLAVGPGNKPEIPRTPSMPAAPPQACHSLQIETFPDPLVRQRMASGRPTTVLIVGGGLTSAQLADLAIRRGVGQVFHIMRGPCRVKHFDVDLEWMGKYKNAEQAKFWLADSDQERLDMIKEARGGGSFTPLFHRKLKKHAAAGRLHLHERTSLADAVFEPCEPCAPGDGAGAGTGTGGVWRVRTEPPLDVPPVDYMYFATGVQSDVATLPYLQTMRAKYPVDSVGGFPCITEDLRWRADVPLFVVGRLSAMQLGPAAPNIGGAKVGAERVAWAIEDAIGPGGGPADGQGQAAMAGYLSGHGNMYSALAA